MQAWFLRKCITIYNDIVRRSHLPREHEIRRIMSETGIDLSQYGPAPASEECSEMEPQDDQDGDLGEEQVESEEECEDDPCS